MKRKNSTFKGLSFLFGLICCSYYSFASSDTLLTLNGKFTQGALIRGHVPIGSQVELDGVSVKVSKQGKFVLGFSREAELHHTVSVTTPEGQSVIREIMLEKRDYAIQRIDGVPANMVSPPEHVLSRIRNDSANVVVARSAVTEYDGVFTRFIWPTKGIITGVYGSQRVLNGVPKRPHYGIDIAAPTGTLVIAPAPGVVTLADDLYYSGNTIIIDHGMGVFSTFLHMDTMSVKPGDNVAVGDKIGTMGSTGRSTGAHLDWRINLNKTRLDPQTIVTGAPD